MYKLMVLPNAQCICTRVMVMLCYFFLFSYENVPPNSVVIAVKLCTLRSPKGVISHVYPIEVFMEIWSLSGEVLLDSIVGRG